MSAEHTVPELNGLSPESCRTNESCSLDDSEWLHDRPYSSGINSSDIDLPTMSALEVDAILDGLSATAEPEDTRLCSVLNPRTCKSTDNLCKIPLTIEQSSSYRTENFVKLRASSFGGSIDSCLDGKIEDQRPGMSHNPLNTSSPRASCKRANNDNLHQGNIVTMTSQCVPDTVQNKLISFKKSATPWLHKNVLAADSAYSLQLSNVPEVTTDAASLRDRSPIGSLDLATKTGFRPTSLSKIGSREANWAIRLAGLTRAQDTRTKVISVLHRPVSVKSDTTLEPITTASNVPNVTPIKPLHQNVAAQSYPSSGCDDRFKHVCPYPHCGRRYQAEFGLLRHLGKYHLDQVELPRRKRSSLPNRRASHHRPASEERPGASLGLCRVGETTSMEVIRHEYSPGPMVSNFHVIDPSSGDAGITRLNSKANTPVRLVHVEKNSLSRVPEFGGYRLRIVQPDHRVNRNSDSLRSVSLTEESLSTDCSGISCHNGSSPRARSVSDHAHQQNLHGDGQPASHLRSQQHCPSADGRALTQPPTLITSPAHLTHPYRQCMTSRYHKNDTGLVSLSSREGFHSSASIPQSYTLVSDAKRHQTVNSNNRQRTLSVGTESRYKRSVEAFPEPATTVASSVVAPGLDQRSLDPTPRTTNSTSDDECARQMEFISGVHALTYSKNDSITCPIDGCDHVSSGRADLSAHLTGVHFPEVKNQLVRLIFACPVKDCPTVCDDEASFQVHFNRHLFGYLPSDLTDLFSALRSPLEDNAAPSLTDASPVPSTSSNSSSSSGQPTSVLPATGGVRQNVATPPPPPLPATAVDLDQAAGLSNGSSDGLVELLDSPMPAGQSMQPLHSSGRIEWTSNGGAIVRFGDDSFIEKEICGLLTEAGNSELTDHGNLLSALDLIPDSLLMELLKEERPWWVEATNCPAESVSKDRTAEEEASGNLSETQHTGTSQDCLSSTECHRRPSVDSIDLANGGAGGETAGDGLTTGEDFTGNRPHSHDSFFDSVTLLTSDSWVPPDVVQQTWSSAVANERPSTSCLLNETGRSSYHECPHNVLSELTAALMLPDVERRLKMSLSAGHSSAGTATARSEATAGCKGGGDGSSDRPAADLRHGRGVCCALKRRRNASESSPSSSTAPLFPPAHLDMVARPCAPSLIPHSGSSRSVKQQPAVPLDHHQASDSCCLPLTSDYTQLNGKDREGGGRSVLNSEPADTACFPPDGPSTRLPAVAYEDHRHRPVIDLPSVTGVSPRTLSPHQAVGTSSSVLSALLPSSSSCSLASPLPDDLGSNVRKKYHHHHPHSSRFDVPADRTPYTSGKVFEREEQAPVSQVDTVERSHSLSVVVVDTKKRKRGQQRSRHTPPSIFQSSLRVIAVAGRPLVSLDAPMGGDSFPNGHINGTGHVAEGTAVFDATVTRRLGFY